MTRLNKALSTMMSQIRELQGTRFWNSPDVEELEQFLTKDQADILVTSPSRGTVIVRKFWKNYHAPPGKRDGRWTTCFQKNNMPDMADVMPDRAKEYRTFKREGFQRVTSGLVEKILAAQLRSRQSMSIGIHGVPSPASKSGQQEPDEPGSSRRRTRGVPVGGS